MVRPVAGHLNWVIGFKDEAWWSRLARPSLSTWTVQGRPLRFVEQSVRRGAADPRALAWYGILVQLAQLDAGPKKEVWLRFVDCRPVSSATTEFLEWICRKLEELGEQALLLMCDNASWHIGAQILEWIGRHYLQVKARGKGVQITVCPLPINHPWLGPEEPRWVPGKRRVVDTDRLLTAQELIARV